jgi:ribosome-associated toxin RatA of RatAB toxin-antitoxin module
MHTENSLFINGSAERIFELAANIQHWPEILPHYTAVDVLEQSDHGNRKVVRMAAVRSDFLVPGIGFPVAWHSIQICEPKNKRIIFKHTGGVARGMWVEWNLTPDPWGRGVKVTISHSLRYPLNFLNGWFAQDLVGREFIQAIAGKTLQTIKQIVESEHPN